MKEVNVTDTLHKSLSNKVVSIIKESEDEGVYIRYKLADRLEERNLTLRDFARLSGLRLATISDLCNGTKQSLNIHHVLVIMVTLRITNLSDIFEIVFPRQAVVDYRADSEHWLLTGMPPRELLEFITSQNNHE